MKIVDCAVTWYRDFIETAPFDRSFIPKSMKVSGYVEYDKRPRRKFNRKSKLRLTIPVAGIQDCFYSMTIAGRFKQDGKRIYFDGRSLG